MQRHQFNTNLAYLFCLDKKNEHPTSLVPCRKWIREQAAIIPSMRLCFRQPKQGAEALFSSLHCNRKESCNSNAVMERKNDQKEGSAKFDNYN